MTQFIRSTAVLLMSSVCLGVVSAEELSPGALAEVGLEARWESQAILNTQRDHVRYLTNDETLVYVQSSAGVVTAFNAENGRQMWSSQIGLNDAYAMEAVSNHNTLLILSGASVYGVNKFDGEELFSFRLPSQPTTTPGMDATSFFIPLTDGSMAGFSLRTLAHLERYGQLPPGVSRPMAWRFVSGEQSVFPPVAGQHLIALATEAGSLHAMNGGGTNAGRSLYQLLLRSPMSAPLTYVVQDGEETLLAASSDNRIFCLSLTKGANMQWVYPMGNPITQPLICIDDSIFVISDGAGLTTLSLTTGRPVTLPSGKPWFVPAMEAVLAVTERRIYAVDLTQRLTILDRKSGQIEARLPVASYQMRIRNSLTDRIYLSTSSGRVVCLCEKGSPFARFHQNPDRQPVMPVVPNSEPQPAATDESAETP